jgi:putative membrane protein
MYRCNFISLIFLLINFLFCNTSFAEAALTDQDFIDLAAIRSISEVETAKIAFAKSTLPNIKAYAQLMIVEQMGLLRSLRDIAKAKRLHMYSEPELKNKARIYVFQRTGKRFDYSYAEMRSLERRKALCLFRAAAELEDVNLRTYAISSLPTLMHHLYMAQTLLDYMNTQSLLASNNF